MKTETQSNWNCVTEHLKEAEPLALGRYVSYWLKKNPRRTLHALSYYKFAAKMIGEGKRVLDVGCNEGLGSWVIAKECGFCSGIDFAEEAIESAKNNFQDASIEFHVEDVLQMESGTWDAVVNFDVIEHIYPEHEERFLEQMKTQLHAHGMLVLGTPSEISQQFASEISKKGHVNIYSPERLEKVLRRHFEFVFLFAANDELVHTGYLPLAHYLVAVACGPKI